MQTLHDYPLRASSLSALDAMEIRIPTPIQTKTIPPLLEGRDVIGQAYTGSGKTLAFGLPLVEHVDGRLQHLQALVLCPTRELAQQVGGVIAQLVAGTDIRSTAVFGGRAFGPQQDAMQHAQVVVGTCGRILDHANRGTIRLDRVKFLVLDEADEMLDRGFGPDVERIIKLMPEKRQTALFSATTPDWVHRVSAKYLHDPVVIQSAPDEDDVPDIDHVVYEVFGGNKFAVLCQLLDEPTAGASLVFRRTKRGVRNLTARLHRMGYPVEGLQGDLPQQQRDRVLGKFRGGKTSILVATNVAARGLDVLHIERVINYDVPDTHELFTHRVGRTGRMGRSGLAITLLGATDLSKWHEIERGLDRKLPRMNTNGEIVLPDPPTQASDSKRNGRRTFGQIRPRSRSRAGRR